MVSRSGTASSNTLTTSATTTTTHAPNGLRKNKITHKTKLRVIRGGELDESLAAFVLDDEEDRNKVSASQGVDADDANVSCICPCRCIPLSFAVWLAVHTRHTRIGHRSLNPNPRIADVSLCRNTTCKLPCKRRASRSRRTPQMPTSPRRTQRGSSMLQVTRHCIPVASSSSLRRICGSATRWRRR